jgi:hypothetical protein
LAFWLVVSGLLVAAIIAVVAAMIRFERKW